MASADDDNRLFEKKDLEQAGSKEPAVQKSDAVKEDLE